MEYEAAHELQFFFTLDSLSFIVEELVAVIMFNISFKIGDLFSSLFEAIDCWQIKAGLLQARNESLNILNIKTLRESNLLATNVRRLLSLLLLELNIVIDYLRSVFLQSRCCGSFTLFLSLSFPFSAWIV